MSRKKRLVVGVLFYIVLSIVFGFISFKWFVFDFFSSLFGVSVCCAWWLFLDLFFSPSEEVQE